MVLGRLRPEAKPEHISYPEWENSECDKSPTGSHWFISRSRTIFQCRFCGVSRTWSDPTKLKALSKQRKKLGRPRKVKENI